MSKDAFLHFSNDQLQSVLDHYSLGKVISSHSFGESEIKIHEEVKEFPDLLTGKLIARKQFLTAEEIVIKTTHGTFYCVVTNPTEEHWVRVKVKDWGDKLKKRLGLTHVELLKIKSGMYEPVSVHQFDRYFYVFSL